MVGIIVKRRNIKGGVGFVGKGGVIRHSLFLMCFWGLEQRNLREFEKWVGKG
jgi:hypothetical protein